MNSKWLKADASTAKRTATSLRKMAERLGTDVESKGVLLAAARIADRIADTKANEAVREKRNEDYYAAAIAKAKNEAEAKIRADWPMNLLTQKLALIRLEGEYALRSAVRFVTDETKSRYRTNEQLLQSLVDDAFREVVGFIAHATVSKKTDVVTQVCEFARKFEAFTVSAEVKSAAETIAPSIAPQQVAA